MNVQEISRQIQTIRSETSKVFVGHDDIVTDVLIAILARGHVLLEGVPGLGKTLLVRALGLLLGCEFKRIQFTPDLMPSDIAGGNVFDQRTQQFTFVPGPVFTQLCLADEINRAPAKTQAALLEAMQDRSVTTDGVTRPLPAPFFVIATQNPVESQGTYPLPEAQLDRFLMKLQLRHPSAEHERQMLGNVVRGFDASRLEMGGLGAVTSAAQIIAIQDALVEIGVQDKISEYIVDIVGRTRTHKAVYLGASPRASIALVACGRARAAIAGRFFVSPDDIKALAPAVLRHRLIMQPDAEIEGFTADDCIEQILRDAPVPQMVS